MHGGGGFIDDKVGLTQAGLSQTQSPSAARKRDEQTLIPVSIKQVMGAETRDSKFKIDSKDINQITVVGQILTVEQQPTYINYLLDDGSGKINVRLYADSDAAAPLPEGTYVRVLGNLGSLGSNMSIVGFQVLPVTDFNEITFHALEVIHTHLRNTNAPSSTPPGGAPSSQQLSQGNSLNSNNNMMNNNNMNNNMNMGMGMGNPNSIVGPDGHSAGQGGAMDKGSKIQEEVMQVFSRETGDAGTHVDVVCKELSHIPRAEIMKAIDFLSDEGHLYSTIDEMHFGSTAQD